MGSLIIQICGLLLVIGFSVVVKSVGRAIILAVIIMEGANIIGQGIMADGGPGMCVGFVLLPILGVILVVITHNIAKYLRQSKQDSQDGKEIL